MREDLPPCLLPPFFFHIHFFFSLFIFSPSIFFYKNSCCCCLQQGDYGLNSLSLDVAHDLLGAGLGTDVVRGESAKALGDL